jgi:hypothetical protein
MKFVDFIRSLQLPLESFFDMVYRYSSVSIVTRLWAGQSEFDSRQGLGIFLFATASRPALRSTQPPIQWVPRVLSPGVKGPGREADYSPQYSTEVKNL